jgi:hypothetical protein
MVQFFDEIPDFLIKWIEQQEMFWVASAPLATDGHINVSPKGLAGSFHVVDPKRVWYEDCTGSGEFLHNIIQMLCGELTSLGCIYKVLRQFLICERTGG